MEPFTQALLGAATAELVAGRRLGGRALGWGAAVGMSPDLDVILGPLRDGYGEWLYHRGTTHSLWFGFVAGPVLGWILWRWRDFGRVETLRAWIALAIVALVTHPLLDGFTPYGTQFLAPFSRERFAWNGVAIVDPLYSIILGTGVYFAARRQLPEARRRFALATALGLSTAYLLGGLAVDRWVRNDLRTALADAAPTIDRIRAYPTIFQPWLRSFVVQTPDAILVGLHSWMDPGCPSWLRHPRPDTPATRAVRATWEGALLEWFADGDVGVFEAPNGDGRQVRFEDLRYSWASPDGRGMWGVEARVGADGEIEGGVHRFPRTGPTTSDLGRLGKLLAGQLPGATEGWTRPKRCLIAAR